MQGLFTQPYLLNLSFRATKPLIDLVPVASIPSSSERSFGLVRHRTLLLSFKDNKPEDDHPRNLRIVRNTNAYVLGLYFVYFARNHLSVHLGGMETLLRLP